MNNSQFRKLLGDTPARQGESNNPSATPRRDGGTPSALGSRMRSSIPMTPRSIATSGGVDFARQLRERNAAASSQEPRVFKSRTAKGSKLASGYTDRTKTRVDQEEDDKAKRIKSLEEMMKLQQIDQHTFEKLRDEIVGGDVESVHLVKGLDFKLLERVRRGEDVLAEKEDQQDTEADNEDVDDKFEELEVQSVKAVARDQNKKKGEMAPPSLLPGQKRTRDSILAEMKAARLAAKEKAAPVLGSKFRKVGVSKPQSRIEWDGRGREILITVDENGNEKRKVRKVQVNPENERGNGLLMPDKDLVPLGMEIPEATKPATPEEDEDTDIFDDVGDDYDPLAGLSGSDSESDGEEGELNEKAEQPAGMEDIQPESKDASFMPPPPLPNKPAKSRNYFGQSSEPTPAASAASVAMQDPTILAALKKASSLDITKAAASTQTAEEKALAEKRKRMLQNDDRDLADMDMGFGSSRFEDEADFDVSGKDRLDKWGEEDGEGEDSKGDKAKRKRGPKKRKGDGNNAADVMRVLEQRKSKGGE